MPWQSCPLLASTERQGMARADFSRTSKTMKSISRKQNGSFRCDARPGIPLRRSWAGLYWAAKRGSRLYASWHPLFHSGPRAVLGWKRTFSLKKNDQKLISQR